MRHSDAPRPRYFHARSGCAYSSFLTKTRILSSSTYTYHHRGRHTQYVLTRGLWVEERKKFDRVRIHTAIAIWLSSTNWFLPRLLSRSLPARRSVRRIRNTYTIVLCVCKREKTCGWRALISWVANELPTRQTL